MKVKETLPFFLGGSYTSRKLFSKGKTCLHTRAPKPRPLWPLLRVSLLLGRPQTYTGNLWPRALLASYPGPKFFIETTKNERL